MNTKIQNLWGLDKAPSIKAILLLLQHKVGPDSFALLDVEQPNDKAVRIIPPNNPYEVSAYIYSYSQRRERYGLDLEFPYLIETRADDQTIRLNDLTDADAVEKIIEHLELSELNIS